jgi:integral membrane protein
MLETRIGQLRAAGLIEGASYLVLLGIAMPLKYMAGMPLAVKIVGWVHGVLFIAFCVALARAANQSRWGFFRTAGVFVAALVPFGTFAIDAWLKRQTEPAGSAAAPAP